MKTLLTFCFVFVAGITVSLGQQSLSLSVGMDIPGLGYGYKFQQGGNILQRGGTGYYSANVAFQSKLRYRVGPYFGLEASYNLVEYDMGVHDVKYLSDNNLPKTPQNTTGSAFAGQPGYLGAFKYYSSPGLAAYGFIPLYGVDESGYEASGSIYLTGGMLFNRRMGNDLYTNFYRNNAKKEELLLSTRYANYFNTTYCEAGVTFTSWGNVVTNLGLKYVFGGPMMQADYTNTTDGILVSADKVTAGSSYFALTFNIGYTFWEREKYTHKKEIDKHEKEIVPTPPVVKDTIKKEKNLNSRNISIANTLPVSGDSIIIEVRDDGSVDGDIISLNYNGEWILKDYTLTTEKHILTVPLLAGENKLVLYTESEGRYKPCTASIHISDKKHEYWLELSSDFKKSSALVLKNGE